MKITYLVLGFSILLHHATAYAGVDAHGGSAVLCKIAGGSQTAEAYDRYEGVEMSGLLPDLGTPQLAYEQKVELFIARVEKKDVLRAERYKKIFDLFKTSTAYVSRSTINDISDATTFITPNGDCYRIQAAVQRHQVGMFERNFLIDNAIWQLMDSDSKAMLTQHEIIYYDEVERGAKNSDGSRLFNEIMSSKNGDTLSEDDYITVMRQNLSGVTVVVLFNGVLVYYTPTMMTTLSAVLVSAYQTPFLSGNLSCAAGSTIRFNSNGSFQKCSNAVYRVAVRLTGSSTSEEGDFLLEGTQLNSSGTPISGNFYHETLFDLPGGRGTLHCSGSSTNHNSTPVPTQFADDGTFTSCEGSVIFKTPEDQSAFGECTSPAFYPSGALHSCQSRNAKGFFLKALQAKYVCTGLINLDEQGNLQTCTRAFPLNDFPSSFVTPISFQGHPLAVLLTKFTSGEHYGQGVDHFTSSGMYVGRFRIVSDLPYVTFQTLDKPVGVAAQTSYRCGEAGEICAQEVTMDVNENGLVTRIETYFYDRNRPQRGIDTVIYEHIPK